MEIQKRIENYWQGEVARYSYHIWTEMNSFKKKAWETLIDTYRPQGASLKALDIGTGPGFFAMVLSGMGHRVTAIDCTEGMLQEAQRNMKTVGLTGEFYQMDSHELGFEPETFDLLICRDLTWTLRDPRTAYREWYRILKPQGRLLIFDSNWNLRFHDAAMKKRYQEDQARAVRLGIEPTFEAEESKNISRQLFFSTRFRPQWDASALMEIGFQKLWIDTDVSDRVWDEKERVLYRSTPVFLICAEK